MNETLKTTYLEDWERTVANKTKDDLLEIMRHQDDYESDFIDLVKEELSHRPDVPGEDNNRQTVSEEYTGKSVIKKTLYWNIHSKKQDKKCQNRSRGVCNYGHCDWADAKCRIVDY